MSVKHFLGGCVCGNNISGSKWEMAEGRAARTLDWGVLKSFRYLSSEPTLWFFQG